MNPDIRLVQLTDLHLTDNNELLFDRVDTWQTLCTALSAAAHFNPDAVLMTGDISNNEAAVLTEFSVMIEKVRHELGRPIIILPGNHGTAANCNELNTAPAATGPEPGDSIRFINGLRLVTLNTHGQGVLQGHLTDAQYTWIQASLTSNAPAGTVIAMHHPPVPTAHTFLSMAGLAEPWRLADSIEATDVRLIISGHFHLPTASMLGHVPVWSGPALSYQQNAAAPSGILQGLVSTGISVLDFFAETHAVVPVPLNMSQPLFSRPVPEQSPTITT